MNNSAHPRPCVDTRREGRVDGDVRRVTRGKDTLTRMGDREAVGRLEVVDVVVEVERLLRGVLVGVVELDGEPERAVLLHRGTHEQSPFEEMENQEDQNSVRSSLVHSVRVAVRKRLTAV